MIGWCNSSVACNRMKPGQALAFLAATSIVDGDASMDLMERTGVAMREHRDSLAAAAPVWGKEEDAPPYERGGSVPAPIHGSGEVGGVVDKLDVFRIIRFVLLPALHPPPSCSLHLSRPVSSLVCHLNE